ncbi:hypothetical protein KIN20_033773 [Parelaphostrongylus tenuis]|uniref:Histone H2A/H2B/H3 domain-containing protein n=1 Tax=Parelaphostrongylus tenuis TaxID=148309 RepID=A0AAD5WIQ0_PARTN|nr:hypothetical protein KIN20_033773 [Parelaphostrongylus tenuis]
MELVISWRYGLRRAQEVAERVLRKRNSTEIYLACLSEDTNVAAMHAGRVTIMSKACN